jgi:TolB-like protein/tetratricopeptide (TPR) repeat protein
LPRFAAISARLVSAAPASSSSGAVFLSYAREDSVAVQRVADALRAGGVEVWFDQNELVGGDAWDAKIRQQIASCALFVPVISANTQARREGYFRLEWRLAAQRTHMISERTAFLLPAVIDATREAEADVPVEFKAVQWTRLAEGASTPQFVERIKRLLEPTPVAVLVPASGAAANQAAAGPSVAPRRRAFGWIFAAVAVALVVVGAFFLVRRPAATDKSIAVLPFANLGADKNDEYLGDGMTEELLNVFAKLPKLKVAARTSSFYFKGKNLPISEVGKQLGVAYVLEGSVRRTGTKLRITTQLINAADGYHLWSETYDRDMNDLLAIQTEVSQQVVTALLGRLGVEESRVIAKRATENPEAHRLYLLGRYHFGKNTRAGWDEAIRSFNEALRLDPNYALAYCGISDTYGWIGGNTMPGREAWAKEEETSRKAIAIEPDLAEGHFSLGLALASMFRFDEGEAAMRRALSLNPNLALAHDQLGWLLQILGRSAESVRHSQRALELEPASVIFYTDFALNLFFMRRFDEGLAQARRGLALNPNDAGAHTMAGLNLAGLRRFPEAITEMRRAVALDGLPWVQGRLGWMLALSGDRSGAEETLKALDEIAATRYVGPGAYAPIFMGLGETEKVFDWLDRAAEAQDGVCWYLLSDPTFDPVRDDPRFKAVLKKVGLDK